MKVGNLLRVVTSMVSVGAVVYALRTRQTHGKFLFVPFEFRIPTSDRFRERWWNPDDERILTPHVFGVGWSVNAYQVASRLGLIEPEGEDPSQRNDRPLA